jgi:hypothetical protein
MNTPTKFNKPLSSLIMEGSMMVRHTTGHFLCTPVARNVDARWQSNGTVAEACAVGLAAVGLAGTTDLKECRKKLMDLQLTLSDTNARVPAPPGYKFPSPLGTPVVDAIIHLNDDMKWSPKQTAEWLREHGY